MLGMRQRCAFCLKARKLAAGRGRLAARGEEVRSHPRSEIATGHASARVSLLDTACTRFGLPYRDGIDVSAIFNRDQSFV